MAFRIVEERDFKKTNTYNNLVIMSDMKDTHVEWRYCSEEEDVDDDSQALF